MYTYIHEAIFFGFLVYYVCSFFFGKPELSVDCVPNPKVILVLLLGFFRMVVFNFQPAWLGFDVRWFYLFFPTHLNLVNRQNETHIFLTFLLSLSSVPHFPGNGRRVTEIRGWPVDHQSAESMSGSGGGWHGNGTV